MTTKGKRKKGGKRTSKEIKQFLNASYEKNPPETIDDWVLDKELSGATGKVYYNPKTGEAVVAHRGTKGVADWGNNFAYALGAYKLTDRYKKGKKIQEKAEKKYGDKNISTLGHSQGAILARHLGGDTKEVINVNPAYTFEKPRKNEYNVRSSSDVVSGLYAPVAKTRQILFPKYSKKHDITIPSKNITDVLGEHSYDILDRLGDKEVGVGAGVGVSRMIDDINDIGRVFVGWGTNLYDAPRETQGQVDDIYRRLRRGIMSQGLNDEDRAVRYLRQGIENRIRQDNWNRPLDQQLLVRSPEWEINDFVRQAELRNQIRSQSPSRIFNAPQERPPRGAGNNLTSNIMKGSRVANLGYSVDDIKWRSGDSSSESESDEEMSVEGGKKPNIGKAFKKFGKSVSKGFEKMAKGTEYINPMMWAIKDKGTSKLMRQSGQLTNDYLLPAVVEAGKPVMDAVAMSASTALTGNPLLGKAVMDTAWKEMVEKPGYDPRKRQKSEALGEISKAVGQVASAKAKKNLSPFAPPKFGKGRKGGKRTSLPVLTNGEPPEMTSAEQSAYQSYLNELGDFDTSDLRELLEGEVARFNDPASGWGNANDVGTYLALLKLLHQKGGAREGQVDFEDIKWGTFTRMFKEFKREHPRSRVKDLDGFADYVIKNKKKFSDVALKKAHFYKNIIKKGGASPEQIGRASIMRTYAPGNSDIYYTLSDLVHSADNPKIIKRGYSSLFRDISASDEPDAEMMLDKLTPSYRRSLFKLLDSELAKGSAPPETINLMASLLKKDPQVSVDIAGYNDDWGATDPFVQTANKAKKKGKKVPLFTPVVSPAIATAVAPALPTPPPRPAGKTQSQMEMEVKRILATERGAERDKSVMSFIMNNPTFDERGLPAVQLTTFKKIMSRLLRS